jgi:hypothetical protein
MDANDLVSEDGSENESATGSSSAADSRSTDSGADTVELSEAQVGAPYYVVAAAQKRRTAAARKTLAAALVLSKKNKAEDHELWKNHEISQQDFQPESIADMIFQTAILIRDCIFKTIDAASEATNLHHRRLATAVQFIRTTSCMMPAVCENFSQEEHDNLLHYKFERWYRFESKKGRKILDPMIMLRCLEFVEEMVCVRRIFDCCTTCNNFFQQIVIPCFQEYNRASGLNDNAIPEIKRSKKYRLFCLICPDKWRGKGKNAIAARQAAMGNPVGAISMAVMWPIATQGVNPRNFVWYDTLTHFANHEAPSKCRLPVGAKSQMRNERRGPIFSKPNDDQERSVGINIGMAMDKGLVSFTLHICDKSFSEIQIVKMSDVGTAMFQPYSAASLQEARQASGAEAQQGEDHNDDSLALQCAKKWVDEVMIPALRDHRSSLIAEAIRCGTDPNEYTKVLTSTDGEQAPLYAVMENAVAQCREEGLEFNKISAGHSGNTAVPDVCGGFPQVHNQFIERMRSVTEAEMTELIRRWPGVANAIRIINQSAMNPTSKATFRKALALAHEIIQGAITPRVVNDGHRVAGLYPFDRNKMMGKMWPAFNSLSVSDTAHVNRLMDGPFKEIGERQGWVKTSQIVASVREKQDTAITFPHLSANFDNFIINRQGAMYLSHQEVQNMQEERMEEQRQEVEERVQRALSKREINERALIRSNHCEASRSFDDTKQKFNCKCKCGGKWTNGVDGFKSHEKNSKHEAFFPPNEWDQLYPQRAAAAAANAEGDAPGAP